MDIFPGFLEWILLHQLSRFIIYDQTLRASITLEDSLSYVMFVNGIKTKGGNRAEHELCNVQCRDARRGNVHRSLNGDFAGMRTFAILPWRRGIKLK